MKIGLIENTLMELKKKPPENNINKQFLPFVDTPDDTIYTGIPDNGVIASTCISLGVYVCACCLISVIIFAAAQIRFKLTLKVFLPNSRLI